MYTVQTDYPHYTAMHIFQSKNLSKLHKITLLNQKRSERPPTQEQIRRQIISASLNNTCIIEHKFSSGYISELKIFNAISFQPGIYMHVACIEPKICQAIALNPPIHICWCFCFAYTPKFWSPHIGHSSKLYSWKIKSHGRKCYITGNDNYRQSRY